MMEKTMDSSSRYDTLKTIATSAGFVDEPCAACGAVAATIPCGACEGTGRLWSKCGSMLSDRALRRFLAFRAVLAEQ
jgi:hypothetical protein